MEKNNCSIEGSEHEIFRKQKQNLPFYLNEWLSFAFVGHSFPCGNNHPSIFYENINLSEDVCHAQKKDCAFLKCNLPGLCLENVWSSANSRPLKLRVLCFKGSLASLFKEISVQGGCHRLSSVLLCSQMKPYLKKDDSLSSHRCTGVPVRIRLLI